MAQAGWSTPGTGAAGAARPIRVGGPTAHPADEAGQERIGRLEDRVHGLSQALRSRDVIGQAKGVLIAHLQIDADAAFAVLVRYSQHTNTQLAEIAAALVARVRDRGPAPQPAVLAELLAEPRAASSRCPQPNRPVQAGGPSDRVGARRRRLPI